MSPGQGNTIAVKDGGSCRCWCCRPLMLLLLLLLFLRCCCSCRAINQPPRRETNSQTSFSKLTRNSKTPPNFVPKMAQNRSEGRRQLQLQLPLLVLSSADAAAAALAVPALLLLLPCHQQPDIFFETHSKQQNTT